MSFCKDCFIGNKHEGEPEGKTEKLNGVECYIATPSVDYPKDKVLLFLSDVFGLALTNNLLLADDFAKNGFKTVLVDLFDGHPRPENPDPSFDATAWRKGVLTIARPSIDKVVAALKEQGVTSFAATGYCFGARYVFDLAFEGISQASVVAHPSMLQVPSDLEKYAAETTAPLLINSCETDAAFPIEAQAKADEILGNGKFKPGYERTYWEGCKHGFAVRGDLSDPKVKAGKEGAFKASVEFLQKYF